MDSKKWLKKPEQILWPWRIYTWNVYDEVKYIDSECIEKYTCLHK